MFIRGHKVMLDSDLAALYLIETGQLVRRSSATLAGFLVISHFNSPPTISMT